MLYLQLVFCSIVHTACIRFTTTLQCTYHMFDKHTFYFNKPLGNCKIHLPLLTPGSLYVKAFCADQRQLSFGALVNLWCVSLLKMIFMKVPYSHSNLYNSKILLTTDVHVSTQRDTLKYLANSRAACFCDRMHTMSGFLSPLFRFSSGHCWPEPLNLWLLREA